MADMEFLDEIPINIHNTLQQLLGRYQAVSDGLPELIKNAKDQYARLGIADIDDRVIVTILNSMTRRLAVLDFAGATKDDFVAWREWANPYANRSLISHDIEGGFGTGGKGFMVRGANENSFFESVRDGLRTKMGYSSTEADRAYYPAFFKEKGNRVDNLKSEGIQRHLDEVLDRLGTDFESLPEAARRVFESRKAFTCVQLNGVRDWTGRKVRQLVKDLPSDLVGHAQASLSIESCRVFVIVDGKLISNKPLQRSYPEPMQGFETLEAIPLPSKLEDPKSGDMVDTGAAQDPGTHILRLSTSRQTLRMTNNKAINVVRIRNARNVVSNWSIADLVPHASSGFIYGTLNVPSLGPEHQVGTDRVALADTALVRALRAWTASQLSELAEMIQKAVSKEHKPQELDKANDSLNKMREAMRKFLEDVGPGGGSGGEDPPPVPQGKTVRQIVLEGGAAGIAMARGTSVPMIVRPYDVVDDKRLIVHGATLELVSDPPNLVSNSRRVLTADATGRTMVWFRDPATGIESNKVEIEVVEAISAEIQELPLRLLLQGEEVPLRIVFNTKRQTLGQMTTVSRADLVVDAEIDEQNMGRVDRYGVFTAGGHEGAATIRVRFGAGANDTVAGTVQVGPDRVPKREKKRGNEGPDVPLILLCGVNAPNLEHYPVEQRTVKPSEQWPTIIDFEPVFENANVIFINQDSMESFQIRRGRGGRRGAAGIGSETFLQFLAIKCFEILKRLYVKQSLKDGAMTAKEFLDTFAEAEITCAPFVEQAFEIARELGAAVKDQE